MKNNILMNYVAILGIDYGIAFGSATRNQQIPEMIPFRLTPQFVSAINPLETTGIIKNCMIHTLRAFRNEQKLLMSCMEVFVLEPTIDWLQVVVQQNYYGEETVASSDSNWDPLLRLQVARRKLIGDNPLALMAEDLKGGVTGQ